MRSLFFQCFRCFVWVLASLLLLPAGCFVDIAAQRCQLADPQFDYAGCPCTSDADCPGESRCLRSRCQKAGLPEPEIVVGDGAGPEQPGSRPDASRADGNPPVERHSPDSRRPEVAVPPEPTPEQPTARPEPPTPERPRPQCKGDESRPCFPGDPKWVGKGICTSGKQYCANGKWSGGCKGHVLPQKEVCNGKDDDCDGTVDNGCKCTNGESRSCGSGTGSCKKGTQKCVGGNWASSCEGSVGPTKEVCNGKDDDCDGKIDNGFDIGAACEVGLGECKARGKKICGGLGDETTTCDATRPKPSPEVCDGKDNDCNGKVDDNVPGLAQSCPVAGKLGLCAQGSTQCVNGKVSCVQTVQPTAEICDGKDNDCDGNSDECQPGDRKCSGNRLFELVCKSDCSGFDRNPCVVTLCQNGRCWASSACACRRGDLTCVPSDLQNVYKCRSDCRGYTLHATCKSGELCYQKACRACSCTPGRTCLNSTTIRECACTTTSDIPCPASTRCTPGRLPGMASCR